MGIHLIQWSAWLFTVVVAILSLWWAKEHWWISVLIVLTFAGASLTFAYEKHRRLRKAEDRHQAEMIESRAREQGAIDRLRQAEQKLLEVPSDILVQLRQIISQYATNRLARLLVERSELILRMKDFDRASNKPLNLRRFFQEAGRLFAAAKGTAEAMEHLRVGDPFLLLRVGTDKLETRIAEMIVQQVTGLEEGVVVFRITVPYGDEIQQIERLTESTDIAGMRGYRIIPTADTGGYPDLDLRSLAEFVNRMVRDLLPGEEN